MRQLLTSRYRLETFSALGHSEGFVEGESLGRERGTVMLPGAFHHTVIHFASSQVCKQITSLGNCLHIYVVD